MSTGSSDTIFLVVIGVFWLKLSIYGTFYSREISEQLEVDETFQILKARKASNETG